MDSMEPFIVPSALRLNDGVRFLHTPPNGSSTTLLQTHATEDGCSDQRQEEMKRRRTLQDFLRLLDHRKDRVEIEIDDAVSLMAHLKRLPRTEFLKTAVRSWLFESLGVCTFPKEDEKVNNIDSTGTTFACLVQLERNAAGLCKSQQLKDIGEALQQRLKATLPVGARLGVHVAGRTDNDSLMLGILLDNLAMCSVAITELEYHLQKQKHGAGLFCGVPDFYWGPSRSQPPMESDQIANILRRRSASFIARHDSTVLVLAKERSEQSHEQACQIL